ncbi:putative orfan [Tupanvirus soda lake]|uniref:Orfan n=2 Tax=Tupanvirus TaxID=2094720 RepID=A0AC62AC18_9VIRU|nr:putative orfan [Tupanvirus soda lake]QKU35289.1 putative orfan [Tupanvirus soda lake]
MSKNIDARLKKEKKIADFFDKFIKKFYPITFRTKISNNELNTLKRCIWYCNISEEPIKELQKFNHLQDDSTECHNNEEYNCEKSDNNKQYKKPLSLIYFEEGYNDYNTYKCGHCIYLIYYLSTIFDYVNSNYSNMINLRKNNKDEEYVENILLNLHSCPICGGNSTNRKDMYIINNSMCTGTIIVKNTYPLKYLNKISSEFTEGDIIDTDGYRGLGLYILENGKFCKMNVGEYYAIIPKHLSNKYGYIKILKELSKCSYNNLPEFDELYITDSLFMNCTENSFHDVNKKYIFYDEMNFNEHMIYIFTTNKSLVTVIETDDTIILSNGIGDNSVNVEIDKNQDCNKCTFALISEENVNVYYPYIKNNRIQICEDILYAKILKHIRMNSKYGFEFDLNSSEKLIYQNKKVHIINGTDEFVMGC